MRIATWNVNSIKMRADQVCGWAETVAPDVLMLQELKCQQAQFPAQGFAALGYQHAAVVGQKAYNGVALLSKRPLSDVEERLAGDDTDEQARFVAATVPMGDGRDVRLICVYVPNGNPPDTPKYPYKLRWLERLQDHVVALLRAEMPFVIGGDFNVIPAPEDVYAPEDWAEDALFRLETRVAFRRLMNLGLTEAYRALHPVWIERQPAYTFWDYQEGRWPRDQGLRIDHFLLSPQAADLLRECRIDREPRGASKPSDHTPVVLELSS